MDSIALMTEDLGQLSLPFCLHDPSNLRSATRSRSDAAEIGKKIFSRIR